MNPLAGLPLDYLIGGNSPYVGSDARITECSYRAGPARRGISIGYCNLFDEENRGNYGPYRHNSDTAEQYNEGEIVPGTDGWRGNLTEQFERRNKEGFSYIELDNPDAYSIEDVLGAIDLAESHSLKVISTSFAPGWRPDALRRAVLRRYRRAGRRQPDRHGGTAQACGQAGASCLVCLLRCRPQLGRQYRRAGQPIPQYGRDLFVSRRIRLSTDILLPTP